MSVWCKALVNGVLVLLLLAGPAFADSGSSNKAAAEALFVEGRRLAGEGKHAEACPKFEASQKLDPGLGTLLNLADCYERIGKTASAWSLYREAIPLARAAASAERETLAQERAKALEERLSTLTIRMLGGDPKGTALDVRRDGVSVDAAELDTPIPVDPGSHEVTASAPGHEPWSQKVEVSPDGAKVVVEIPALGAASSDAAAGAADSGGKKGSAQRPIAIAVGAVGVVGIGLGTYFGLSASSTWKDAKAECEDYPFECSPEGVEQSESASSKAMISTIAFIAGGVALAAGAVLWFTAGSGETKTALGIGPGSITARGQF